MLPLSHAAALPCSRHVVMASDPTVHVAGWLQVESVKLSSESDKRGMQVELANSRKEAAAAAAQLKHALANWQVGVAGCQPILQQAVHALVRLPTVPCLSWFPLSRGTLARWQKARQLSVVVCLCGMAAGGAGRAGHAERGDQPAEAGDGAGGGRAGAAARGGAQVSQRPCPCVAACACLCRAGLFFALHAMQAAALLGRLRQSVCCFSLPRVPAGAPPWQAGGQQAVAGG